MSILHLEVKYIKIQHCSLHRCPNPQFNSECMGLFIKTRRWQKECVACMRQHSIINKHPLLNKLKAKDPFLMGENSVEEYSDPYQRIMAFYN